MVPEPFLDIKNLKPQVIKQFDQLSLILISTFQYHGL